MAPKKKIRTRLPRLTMLAMSEKELQRFSEAAEQICGLAHLMVGLMTRLDSCVTRLEVRSAAAKKANVTRRAAIPPPPPDNGPPPDDGPDYYDLIPPQEPIAGNDVEMPY